MANAALAYYEGGPELSGVVLDARGAAGRKVDPLDPAAADRCAAVFAATDSERAPMASR